MPTIGYRDQEGRVVVRDGQMRVLAAREAGVTVPVVVTDRDTAATKRIVEQLVANEQRTALTATDRLAAFRQLSLEGMTDAAIARETGTKRDQIATTLIVAKSEAATAAVTDRALTLDDALIFAEFQDDPDAIARLHQVIDDGDSDDLGYWAERIRQDRSRREAIAALAAEWEANGVRAVTDTDEYDRLANLTDADDHATDPADRPGLDPDTHATCPGHAVTIRDWGQPTAELVCTTAAVHHPRYLGWRATTAPTVPATPEEEKARREADKVDRRRVRENNKAWDAADALRQKFVRTLLQRKTLPKDWTLFAAISTTRFGYMVRNDMSAGVRELMGIDQGDRYGNKGVADWVEQNPGKAAHVALAFMLSAFENAADRNWWRSPSAEGAAYLIQLSKWGYRLTDVEKIATGQNPDSGTDAASDTE